MTSALDAVRVFEAVDARDVRMIQRGEHLRFALEAGQALGIAARRASGRTLIATSRFSFVSVRAIHLAHAARADGRQDFIGAESRAGSKRHVARPILAGVITAGKGETAD